jgi:hypothetical protein
MPDETYKSAFTKVLQRGARGAQDLTLSALQNLPEVVKTPLRHAVGRVVSNIPTDLAYTDPTATVKGFFDPYSRTGVGDVVKSVIQDRPVPELQTEAHQQARRPLIREYFDLPPQDPGPLPPGHFGQPPPVYLKQGKDYRINPETDNPEAQVALAMFKRGNQVARPNNPVTANYTPGYPDPYNFDLHPDELAQIKPNQPIPANLFARQILETMGHPARVMTGGYYNPPPKENMIPK